MRKMPTGPNPWAFFIDGHIYGILSQCGLTLKMILGVKFRNILYKIVWIIKKYGEKLCPILDTHVSGSPLLQDGRIVGAVTHVLVNDPTMGYAIFIENMLEAAG